MLKITSNNVKQIWYHTYCATLLNNTLLILLELIHRDKSAKLPHVQNIKRKCGVMWYKLG